MLRPASQLLKVLIDATVGRHQGLLRTTASVQTPKVVLVDKVVHQVVPQQNQFLQIVLRRIEILGRHPQAHLHLERDDVVGRIWFGDLVLVAAGDIRSEQRANQRTQSLVCGIRNALRLVRFEG